MEMTCPPQTFLPEPAAGQQIRRRLIVQIAWVLAALAAAILAGWVSGLYPFTGDVPSMKPVTASSFLLLAVFFLVCDDEAKDALQVRIVAGLLVSAGAAFLILPHFGNHLPLWNPGPLTAIILGLLGGALLLHGHRFALFCVTEWLGLAVAALAGTALLAQLYDVPRDSMLFGVAGTSLETSFAGSLAALLLLLWAPKGDFMVLLRDRGPGGRTLRRMVPLALIVLPLLGWLRLYGETLNLYETREGLVYMVSLAIAVVVLVTSYTAAALLREDLARQAMERRRREVAELLDGVVSSTGDAIFVKDPAGRYLLANPTTLAVLGLSEAEVLGHSDDELLPAADAHALRSVDSRVLTTRETVRTEETLRQNGEERCFLSTKSPMYAHDGTLLGVVGIAHEITEQKRLQQAMDWQATHDALTGLANRSLLRDRLVLALAAAERHGNGVALIVIDLDAFKHVNEDLSYAAGDQLLQEVGQRIVRCVRRGDTVARVYGDEFIVVLTEVEGKDWVNEVVQRILQSIAEPWQYEGDEVVLSASAGVSLFPEEAKSGEALERNSEVAMHRAKELGKNRHEFYILKESSEGSRRLDRERELRHALEDGQLALYYQPKIDIESGQIAGAEALLRWQHPTRGLLGPGEFLALAEDSGLIVPISEWVIQEGCTTVARWQAAGLDTGPIALNLSGRQLQDAALAERLTRLIAASGAKCGAIELEVTETSVLRDHEETARILHRFHDMGIKLALDDFGTGYSSLSFLRKFPIACLKIDRSFVRDIHIDPGDAAIARTVIAMAHALKLYAVAEGVETPAQLRYLHHHHCDQFQGYLFSQAVPAETFAGMVANGSGLDLGAMGIGRKHSLLLVDDDENILCSLKRLFRREGYHILTAMSGDEALKILADNEVQVIVSDQRMMGMSGAELLGHVAELFPETIRIMLTGYTNLESVIESVNRGAIYKFLTKPWDDASLREQVRDAFLQHRAKYGR
jgi:diguanylate cyclase (GGDEF)-like protein/PAS domain S-box-containing protein